MWKILEILCTTVISSISTLFIFQIYIAMISSYLVSFLLLFSHFRNFCLYMRLVYLLFIHFYIFSTYFWILLGVSRKNYISINYFHIMQITLRIVMFKLINVLYIFYYYINIDQLQKQMTITVFHEVWAICMYICVC